MTSSPGPDPRHQPQVQPQPYPQHQQPPHPYPQARPPAAPPETSTRGPAWLTVVGAVLVLITIGLAIAVTRTFVGLVDSDLLGPGGAPGSAVVVAVDAPGEGTAELAADTRYAVALVTAWDGRDEPTTDLADDVLVRGPDGEQHEASLSPGVTVSASRSDTTARTVASFRTDAAGAYALEVPGTTDGTQAQVYVLEDQPFLPFFTGIFGTVLGVLAAVFTALLGVPMLVLGIVWWRRRLAARRAVAAATPAA